MKGVKPLTEREKLVLYGLVRTPEEPDVTIAKRLGLPQPTFSNIQRRLRSKRLFSVIGVPDLRAIGVEMLSVAYGTYNPLSSHKERTELEASFRKRFPQIFYKVGGVNEVILFLAGRDLVEVNNVLDTIEGEYLEKGVLERDGLSKMTFTLPTTLFARWFDFSKPLYTSFSLPGKPKNLLPPGPEEPAKQSTSSEFGGSEAKVLLHLCKDPEASDVAIARALKISRTTVARARRALSSSGRYRKLVIPNLLKLGFDVMAFSDSKFNPETTYQQRFKSTKWLLDKLPIFLSVISNKEAVTLYSFSSYLELQEMKRAALIEYKKKGYLRGEPVIKVFSVAEIVDQSPPDFYPLAKALFEAR